MIVYIAGPMRGYPEFNFPSFYEAEARWAAAGWEVRNPARHDNEQGFDEKAGSLEGFDLKAALKWDLEQVFEADAIYMLDGWWGSEGAGLEYHVAETIGVRVFIQSENEHLNPIPVLIDG